MLILFDVDGTLLTRQSVHLSAFLHSLLVVFGLEFESIGDGHHGKTDPWIIEELCRSRNVEEKIIQERNFFFFPFSFHHQVGKANNNCATCFFFHHIFPSRNFHCVDSHR